MATTSDTTITGPAVTFDQAALRGWLGRPSDPSGADATGPVDTLADELGVSRDYNEGAYATDLLSGLDSVLNQLRFEALVGRRDGAQTAWNLGAGIRDIDFFRTWDSDGCDGALIHVDLDNGLRLASLHQDHGDFASTTECGIDAVVAGLTNLATQANLLVTSLHTTIQADREASNAEADLAILHAVRAGVEGRPEVRAVVFEADEWDNGCFLEATGRVFFADGEEDEIDFGIDDLLAEAYGRVGHRAALGVNPIDGVTEFDDYADNVYAAMGVTR